MTDWTRRGFLWGLGAVGASALLDGCQPGFPELEIAKNPREGGLDMTFFIAADTHVGYTSSGYNHDGVVVDLVDTLNALPGTALPGEIGGGVVPEPEMVVVAGDLTEDGLEDEWKRFRDLFDDRLTHRLYESIGNHDEHSGYYVRDQVTARHGDIRYSLDYGDLRIICLGDGTDQNANRWLRRQLAEHGLDRPVILYLHYPMVGPYSSGNWFGRGPHRTQLLDALRGFNIIAIFHGHYHASGYYPWYGYDVFNMGASKHGSNAFGVVRVTDTELTYASYNWTHNQWWWVWRKPINERLALEPDLLHIRDIPDSRRSPAIPYPKHRS